MSVSDKSKTPRQHMAAQEPKKRIMNFEEVPFGYSPSEAELEAMRCLQCAKPQCVLGCPVKINIPAFIKLIQEGKFIEAAQKIKETNSLPAICGRVCPQEEQCEKLCIVGKKGESVAIGTLERYAADFERKSGKILIPKKATPTGKKIAVVGSGPAGLSAAGDLALLGYDVTVFEALHEAGGVLVYGIPEFRLPKAIVKAEVDYLKLLGVKFEMNVIAGRSVSLDELFGEEGYAAVFIGAGAGLPQFMGIPGENSIGVYSSNEYLTRSNLMRAYKFPEYDTPIIRGKSVATIGGGNVAVDAARTALRLGAERSYLVYRRSRDEMPARREEICHAEEEGVLLNLLTLPLEIKADEKGFVKSIYCQKMQLGAPDASGRKKPEPIAGTEFEIAVDIVVVAIGNNPSPLLSIMSNEIKTEKWGGIIVDEWGRTSKARVYAGGDVVTGAATVIEAMGAGKRAALAIHQDLTGK